MDRHRPSGHRQRSSRAPGRSPARRRDGGHPRRPARNVRPNFVEEMIPMPNPEPQARLAMLRKSEIGRVTLYVVSGSVTHGVPIEEAASPGQRRQEPPYLLVAPMRLGLRYSQQGRAERVFGGDYVLLSQKAGFALEIERGGEAL